MNFYTKARRSSLHVAESVWGRWNKTLNKADNREYSSIAWISSSRTGSTYLCDLLSCHPNIDSNFEIYHRSEVFCKDISEVITKLNQELGTQFRGSRDPALVSFAHENPGKLLDCFREISGNNILSFKLFPRHLSRWQYWNHIIADRSIVKVLFSRDLFSTHLSLEKARQSRQWEFADTSAAQVTLDLDRFISHIKHIQSWHRSAENLLRASGQPIVKLNYETLFEFERPEQQLQHIVDLLRQAGLNLVSVNELPDSSISVKRVKQNTAKSFRDVVFNYDEFCQSVIKSGWGNYLPMEEDK